MRANRLAGLTVIDLTSGLAGSVMTMMLADYGAEVIKVEPLSGDPLRSLKSYSVWQRGKKSFMLEIERAGGREQLKELLSGSDIVVESIKIG